MRKTASTTVFVRRADAAPTVTFYGQPYMEPVLFFVDCYVFVWITTSHRVFLQNMNLLLVMTAGV